MAEAAKKREVTAVRAYAAALIVGAIFAAQAFASADLSVSVTDDPDPVTRGSNVNYTITLTNSGPDAATGVDLFIRQPVNASFTTFSQRNGPAFSCSPENPIVCSIASFPSGASVTFDATANVQSFEPSITCTASVSTSSSDPNETNDSDSETTTVPQAGADIRVTKSTTNGSVSSGEQVTFFITVTNIGSATAQNVVMTDPLPGAMTATSVVASKGDCTGTSTITCQIGTLATSESVSITINANAPLSAALYTNTASATTDSDSNPGNNSASATFVVSANGADLLTLMSAPSGAAPNTDVSVFATLDNNGPDTASSPTLTITLPAAVALLEIKSDLLTCQQASNIITCQTPTFTAGSSAVVELRVHITAESTNAIFQASATSTTTDPNPTNNTATATMSISGSSFDLAASFTPTGLSVAPSTTFSVTVNATNEGTGAAAGTVLRVSFPSGFVITEITPTQGDCTLEVICNLGTIAAGARASVTLTILAPSTIGSYNAASSVTAIGADANSANNNAALSISVGKGRRRAVGH